MVVTSWQLPIPLGVAVGLATGAAAGLANGVLIAKLKLPSFIATLGNGAQSVKPPSTR